MDKEDSGAEGAENKAAAEQPPVVPVDQAPAPRVHEGMSYGESARMLYIFCHMTAGWDAAKNSFPQ